MKNNSIKHDLSELDILRQSEQRYKLILENANDLISILKLDDLSYEYTNPATIRVLGYLIEELKGKSAIEFIHPDDVARVLSTIKENLEKREGSCEFRYRKKDGSYLWLGATARLLPGKTDNLYLITISRDITDKKNGEEALRKAYDHLEFKIQERISEYIKINQKLTDEITRRKKTEKALKESENYYRAIFETTGTATLLINKDLKITRVNSKTKELSGYSEEELTGKSPFTTFLTPECLDIALENHRLRKLDPDKAPQDYEVRCFDKQGNIKNIILNISVIPESENIVASLLDVTELRQAELLTKKSEERFRTLFEKAPVGIVINRTGIILFANQAYLKMFGYGSTSELNGTLIINQIAPEYQYEVFERIKKREKGETLAKSYETVGMRKDGSNFYVFVEVANIILPDGPANVAYFSDITERKLAEDATKQQVKSQDMLLRISRQFSSIVSDDIDDMIKTTLQELGEFNEADRCYIVLFSGNGAKIDDTHEWCAEGIMPSIHLLRDLPVDLFPWTLERLRRFENVYISDVKKLPAEVQAEKELLQMNSAHSLALVPIIYENSLIGYLGFDSTTKEIVWSHEKNKVLDLAAQTFSNALQRKQFAQALKESENYYRTIFENTGAATAILEADLTISMINKKFEELSGYIKEEIENKKNWLDFVAEENQEMVKEYYHLRNIQSEMVPREYEISFISKHEITKDILIVVDIIPGTLKRAISIVDITLRKQTQKELEDNYNKMQRIMDQTVSSLATAVEIRDPYTAGHQKKLAQLAVAIAEEMGLSKSEIDGISVAGTLHDIGKINVPNEILSKPGRLSEVERMIVKTHCKAGYEIIKGIEFPWPVADIVLQHHERIDGSGYPVGLVGEEIFLGARILAVADVIDAMSSHRPYRPSLGVDVALEEISQNKGILYDPQVVDACLRLFQERHYKLE